MFMVGMMHGIWGILMFKFAFIMFLFIKFFILDRQIPVIVEEWEEYPGQWQGDKWSDDDGWEYYLDGERIYKRDYE